VSLHSIVQGFDSKKRADSREEFLLIDRLREKVVRSGFDPWIRS
jgi:hypothetical protein